MGTSASKQHKLAVLCTAATSRSSRPPSSQNAGTSNSLSEVIGLVLARVSPRLMCCLATSASPVALVFLHSLLVRRFLSCWHFVDSQLKCSSSYRKLGQGSKEKQSSNVSMIIRQLWCAPKRDALRNVVAHWFARQRRLRQQPKVRLVPLGD